MQLKQYIDDHFGGNKSEFARVMGVRRDKPNRWISEGWIVVDGRLYSPQREIPEKNESPSML
ncbi:hypothetical protein EVY06_22000 [Citrobacter koseri]|uniref:Uncharacterized protein n=1 Tax=Citrobacter koseri TaxID=545 RepID=A0AAQ0V8G1_CITKO|nr:hypothetical protein CEP66_18425 [Citrobacter koseri]OFV14066.1 hypothetical protein HMPREF3126_09430 [Salmonella sp. HMSC13B08]ATF97724.1 hypothetical protein CO700_12040 [Citrobacter koseri]AVE68942.1 hypothetical protein AM351_14525 [Citrobacter koseri]KWZ96627.1 hypothetical protein HMPREF3220_03563 [Citrobacter koseri]